jgi:hypothetical protein
MNNANPITNNADVNYSTKKLLQSNQKIEKQTEPGTYIEHISQKIEKFFLRRVLLWHKTCKRKSGNATAIKRMTFAKPENVQINTGWKEKYDE